MVTHSSVRQWLLVDQSLKEALSAKRGGLTPYSSSHYVHGHVERHPSHYPMLLELVHIAAVYMDQRDAIVRCERRRSIKCVGAMRVRKNLHGRFVKLVKSAASADFNEVQRIVETT